LRRRLVRIGSSRTTFELGRPSTCGCAARARVCTVFPRTHQPCRARRSRFLLPFPSSFRTHSPVRCSARCAAWPSPSAPARRAAAARRAARGRCGSRQAGRSGPTRPHSAPRPRTPAQQAGGVGWRCRGGRGWVGAVRQVGMRTHPCPACPVWCQAVWSALPPHQPDALAAHVPQRRQHRGGEQLLGRHVQQLERTRSRLASTKAEAGMGSEKAGMWRRVGV
jgi:hypothetical protein